MSKGSAEIRRLDQQTIERIAAGEVVERPASAVKELVENSIDADAARVSVEVDAGGTDGIRIRDDGVGMDEDALRRAVEEHTTSKIADIADLESGVGTLGFRGEALHAIGAVSRMTITSRPRGGEQGTELTVEGGEITDVSPAGCPEGTTVEIRDLFYNVPARRKYLKQESTEFAHVNSIVTQYALANPDVAISLEHDGRETFATTGSGDLQEAVLAVYGREVAESMIAVEADAASLPAGPLNGVSGLVSHPETNRASREYLSTFVNGRFVTANTVRDAVVAAYGTQLGGDRYPFAVVFLELDPGVVDVNVHPRKLEVRFAADDEVREQVRTAIEEALLADGFLRSTAPRGRSAPDQTEIAPGDVDTDHRFSTDDQPANSGKKSPSGETRASAADRTRQESGDQRGPADVEQSTHAERPIVSERTEKNQGDRSTEQSERSTDQFDRTTKQSGRSTEQPNRPTEHSGRSTEQSDRSVPDSAERDSPPGEDPRSVSDGTDDESPTNANVRRRDGKFRSSGVQVSLGDEERDVDFDRLPAMRILGQLHETYVVAETAAGMVLVDQHAADERINYERLRESLSGETTTQALARPVTIELTAREAALFESHREALARLGFYASLVEERTVEVTTVPSFVAKNSEPELIRDVLGEFVSGDVAASATVEAVADGLLADLACYPSITGNTSLTDGTVLDLLRTLDMCENPYACPHGRPVIVEFDSDEIEARFERDYPGHT